MIRRAAAYAVAASIGTIVGTLTGAVVGAVLATVAMSDKETRAVVVNHYSSNDDPPENTPLQPQDVILEDVDLSSTPAE